MQADKPKLGRAVPQPKVRDTCRAELDWKDRQLTWECHRFQESKGLSWDAHFIR